jgi:hypothetical protein
MIPMTPKGHPHPTNPDPTRLRAKVGDFADRIG